ncbi:MAG: folylpolyglutamate synthase/dihydrofolate synthase family protein [Thermomicrobiales bacterium]
MDYQSALEYFRDRSDYDRGFISNPFAGDDAAAAGLTKTRRLLDELGSPDRAYPIIHVAGTKGKGSTCAFIESVARACGNATGLFTTPHLHTVRERIQISGAVISEEDWASVTESVATAVATVEREEPDLGRITAFEFNTAMALLHLAQSDVDLGIVEVGLGGRLDATNVVMPAVTVITPVSFDHQAILGDSLAEISIEKAGIIKPGVPVVVSPQEAEAMDSIGEVAADRNAPVYRSGSEWHAGIHEGAITLSGPWGTIREANIGLAGQHQAMNAGAALMALWLWQPELFGSTERIREGLEGVRWPGRFETVRKTPPVIVDGAHNGASMETLAASLLDRYAGARFVVVFGSYVDKDLPAMLAALSPLDPDIIATRSSSPRARPSSDIDAAGKETGLRTIDRPDFSSAMSTALEMAEHNTVIVATGSLSIVAEAREHLGLAEVSNVERAILSG